MPDALGWVAEKHLGWRPERARLLTAGMNVAVLLLLLGAIGLFLEWRLVAFEEKGCVAFCNCTGRWMNRTYALDEGGEWFLVEDEVDMDAVDDLVEKLEACKDGWDGCAVDLFWHKNAFAKRRCPT